MQIYANYFKKIMQIYKIIFSLLTFFPYLFIFLWEWSKGACRMQTDRSTDKVSDLRQELANIH